MALAALAACGGGQQGPQGGPAPAGGPSDVALTMEAVGGGPPSIYGLIGDRERLSLTSAQVNALDSISVAWSAADQVLRRELREAWGGDRPRGGDGMVRARPVLERIAINNQVATEGVEALLNEEQRGIACQLQAEQRAERGQVAPRVSSTAPRGPGGGAPRARPNAAEVQAMDRGPRGWPWCAAARPDAPPG
jgi:hypothetical protein